METKPLLKRLTPIKKSSTFFKYSKFSDSFGLTRIRSLKSSKKEKFGFNFMTVTNEIMKFD